MEIEPIFGEYINKFLSEDKSNKTKEEIYGEYNSDPMAWMHKHGCGTTKEISLKLMEIYCSELQKELDFSKRTVRESVEFSRDLKRKNEYLQNQLSEAMTLINKSLANAVGTDSVLYNELRVFVNNINKPKS